MVKYDILKYYMEVFGKNKMVILFDEFKQKTQSDFIKAKKNNDTEETRIIFHNLRSSALVFGMKKCSDEAERIERKILKGQNVSLLEIEKCEKIYLMSLEQVERLLK